MDIGGLRWAPNVPEAVILADDRGVTALALRAHMHDADQRCVVFVWRHTDAASMGGPNDEGLPEHPLWDRGLSEILWLGRVEPDPSAERSLVHHVLPLKECVVEVVAKDFSIARRAGSTLDVAVQAIRG